MRLEYADAAELNIDDIPLLVAFLDSDFEAASESKRRDIRSLLEKSAARSGYKGDLALVWLDASGRMKFVAAPQQRVFLQSLNYDQLHAQINRKLAVPLAALRQLEGIRCEWDERALENARHYIHAASAGWTDEEFFESGRRDVKEEILDDFGNVFQGKDPKQMTVLEIGCGTGRITRALAEVFGQVYAVDVSGEMIAKAKGTLADLPNVRVFQNNGSDLRVLEDVRIDFAFSFIAFQRIPGRDVIYSYTREVFRLLRPGGLFKFQVQGHPSSAEEGPDTWMGVNFTDADAVEMARACGFEPRYRLGVGSQYFWLWFFKPQAGRSTG